MNVMYASICKHQHTFHQVSLKHISITAYPSHVLHICVLSCLRFNDHTLHTTNQPLADRQGANIKWVCIFYVMEMCLFLFLGGCECMCESVGVCLLIDLLVFGCECLCGCMSGSFLICV